MALMTPGSFPLPATPGLTYIDTYGAAYQRLALQLHHDTPRGESRRVALLTTANAAPQAALAGIALAHSLAEQLQRPILCVDAHAKGGDASRALGCVAAPGLTDLMLDPALGVADLALPTSNPMLRFLPAGVAGASGRARSPEQVERAVRALEDGHDFVVLIGGSVLDDTSALAITPHVGTVVLLAFENQTLLTDLDQAQRALRFCKARHIGLVISTSGRN
jgi:hypothetical protein